MSDGPSAVDGGPDASGVILWSEGVRTMAKQRARPAGCGVLHPAFVFAVRSGRAAAGLAPAGPLCAAPRAADQAADPAASTITAASVTAKAYARRPMRLRIIADHLPARQGARRHQGVRARTPRRTRPWRSPEPGKRLSLSG